MMISDTRADMEQVHGDWKEREDRQAAPDRRHVACQQHHTMEGRKCHEGEPRAERRWLGASALQHQASASDQAETLWTRGGCNFRARTDLNATLSVLIEFTIELAQFKAWRPEQVSARSIFLCVLKEAPAFSLPPPMHLYHIVPAVWRAITQSGHVLSL